VEETEKLLEQLLEKAGFPAIDWTKPTEHNVEIIIKFLRYLEYKKMIEALSNGKHRHEMADLSGTRRNDDD
jgi:hypothetical protein